MHMHTGAVAQIFRRGGDCDLSRRGAGFGASAYRDLSAKVRTAHRSPLTPHLSPLTAHSSPLTAHRSPLTPHLSPLTAHRSLLTPRSKCVLTAYCHIAC